MSISFGQDIQSSVLQEWQKAINQFAKFSGDFSVNREENDRIEDSIGKLVFKDFNNFYLNNLNEGKLSGRNSDDSFSLIGNPTSDKWYLEKLVEFPNTHEEKSIMLGFDLQRALPYIGLVPISSVLDSETINVIVLNHNEDANFIEVDFEHFNPSVDMFGDRSLRQAGILKLDPNNHFLPISYELKFELIGDDETIKSKMKGVTRGKCDYDGSFLRKSYMEEMFNDFEMFVDGKKSKDIKPMKFVISVEITDRSAMKLTDSDFRLKAFGLPEPNTNNKRSIFVSIVYGLLIIVIFFVFYRLSPFKFKG